MGPKEALQQQRKVISIACSNDQILQLETICMATIEEDDALRKWARLDGNGKEDASLLQTPMTRTKIVMMMT